MAARSRWRARWSGALRAARVRSSGCLIEAPQLCHIDKQLRKIYGFRGASPGPPPPHSLSALPHTDTTAAVTTQAIAAAQDAATEAEDARRKANVHKLVRVNARGSAVGTPRQSIPAATMRGRV